MSALKNPLNVFSRTKKDPAPGLKQRGGTGKDPFDMKKLEEDLEHKENHPRKKIFRLRLKDDDLDFCLESLTTWRQERPSPNSRLVDLLRAAMRTDKEDNE